MDMPEGFEKLFESFDRKDKTCKYCDVWKKMGSRFCPECKREFYGKIYDNDK